MSQFSSLSGRGNYAIAGRAAADDALRSFLAAREYSPDYGRLAQESAIIKNQEKLALIDAKTKVARTAVEVEGRSKANEILLDAKADADSDKRFAGKLAYAAGLVGKGMYGLSYKERETPDISGFIDKYNNQIEDLNTKAEGIRNDATSFSTSTDGNNIGDQQGIDSAGKAGGPVSSAEAMQVTGYTPPKDQKMFSVPEMQNLLMNAGMSKDNARILSAVGKGESGGRAGIDTVKSGLDPTKSNEYSVGLFQINAPFHMDKLKKRGYTVEDLRDPQKNANIAVDVFNEFGSFTPWTVYNDNKYQQYLID